MKTFLLMGGIALAEFSCGWLCRGTWDRHHPTEVQSTQENVSGPGYCGANGRVWRPRADGVCWAIDAPPIDNGTWTERADGECWFFGNSYYEPCTLEIGKK